MRRSMPDGTVIRVGASTSMRWRSDQSRPDFSAFARSSSPSASRRVLPAKAGCSQSSSVAISASSDRSGRPRSGIQSRRQRTRSRHCRSDSGHGSASRPRSRTASVSAAAASAGSTRPAGRASNTIWSKRDSRCADSARRDASQRTVSSVTKRSAKSRRRHRSSTGAARCTSASRASWRSSLTTIHGSPTRALSSNSRALRPFASR